MEGSAAWSYLALSKSQFCAASAYLLLWLNFTFVLRIHTNSKDPTWNNTAVYFVSQFPSDMEGKLSIIPEVTSER